MKLIYLEHSGFLLCGDDFNMVIDYYKGQADVSGIIESNALNVSKPLYVLASHSHPDHFNTSVLDWRLKSGAAPVYIFSSDITGIKTSVQNPVFISAGDEYSDSVVRLKAFGSTDEGVSLYIEAGGKKIFHAGDLNNWHWDEESTAEEVRESEDAYLKELAIVAREIKNLDLAMFPIDKRLGGGYMRGAEQFLDAIRVKLFAPMHFWGRFDILPPYKEYAQKSGTEVILWKSEGQEIEF
ncbi:MAG: MBL fold metallo-hydrolase [Synergistaceae bacterium]|nr:MBL fold metallo-hydrolase [Synergistaceae bacterium]